MKAVTRVSRQDAAARLNVPEATIDRMIRLGDLETEKESHGSKAPDMGADGRGD